MFLNQRYFKYFDWFTFLCIIMLCAIGLLFIFSATYQPELPYSPFFKRQVFGILSGIFIYLACSFSNYFWFCSISYRWNIVFIALLIFTLFKGTVGLGAQRWINVLFFRFQPSELAKIFFPPFFTYHLFLRHEKFSVPIFYLPLAVLGITTFLILKQPDLGTALLFFSAGLLLLWFSGLNKKFFLYFFLVMVVGCPLGWKILKPYQKQRLSVFLGYGDDKKERYQIEQARIAIGSGGITGKGFLQGTQNKLFFLPEGRTDFIFAVICEECGFLGALLILLFYSLLFGSLLLKIKKITSPPAQTLAFGLLMYPLLSTIINLGMVLGLLPTVGIPLPFISYGSSNLWTTLASLGIIQSIFMRETYRGNT